MIIITYTCNGDVPAGRLVAEYGSWTSGTYNGVNRKLYELTHNLDGKVVDNCTMPGLGTWRTVLEVPLKHLSVVKQLLAS